MILVNCTKVAGACAMRAVPLCWSHRCTWHVAASSAPPVPSCRCAIVCALQHNLPTSSPDNRVRCALCTSDHIVLFSEPCGSVCARSCWKSKLSLSSSKAQQVAPRLHAAALCLFLLSCVLPATSQGALAPDHHSHENSPLVTLVHACGFGSCMHGSLEAGEASTSSRAPRRCGGRDSLPLDQPGR